MAEPKFLKYFPQKIFRSKYEVFVTTDHILGVSKHLIKDDLWRKKRWDYYTKTSRQVITGASLRRLCNLISNETDVLHIKQGRSGVLTVTLDNGWYAYIASLLIKREHQHGQNSKG